MRAKFFFAAILYVAPPLFEEKNQRNNPGWFFLSLLKCDPDQLNAVKKTVVICFPHVESTAVKREL